jgi:S1-C subfamily serine protease
VRRGLGALLIALAAGDGATACAPRGPARPDYVLLPDEDDPAAGGHAEPAGEIGAAPAPGPRVSEGTILRNELLPVLDGGPGRFLQGIQIRAWMVDGRFAGWEIVSYRPKDPRYATVDLTAGDVVTSVNGVRLERPDQLQQVWDGLRTAPALVVDYLRGAEPRRLQFAIAD